MKKFKNLSDLDILYAAHNHYLEIAQRNQGIANKTNGQNSVSNRRAEKSWLRVNELRDEILRLERKGRK